MVNGQGGIFFALADTLMLWAARLYEQLERDGVHQVFFLSREGQPLQRMFEAYAQRAGGGPRSYYLEVSRRATLLPSLGPLARERFDTLFRQYRAISLEEFLASLGLHDALRDLVPALGTTVQQAGVRQDDFPTSELFERLLACEPFRRIYEARRVEQHQLFVEYLRELAGGSLPTTLAVVDVGWKGTIQDHLYSALCRDASTGVEKVQGYYLGLVAAGAATETNAKTGLLFSCIGERTRGFSVFNENKSLFEIILAADHGSVTHYARDTHQRARPVHGVFDESDMLTRSVFPVLRQIERRFDVLLQAPMGSSTSLLLDDVIASHARMVFRPSPSEYAWFDAIFHVENFGLFERSHFSGSAANNSFRSRVGFLMRVLRRRNVGELGFWPWATLRRRGGRAAATVYAIVRRWQAGRGSA